MKTISKILQLMFAAVGILIMNNVQGALPTSTTCERPVLGQGRICTVPDGAVWEYKKTGGGGHEN